MKSVFRMVAGALLLTGALFAGGDGTTNRAAGGDSNIQPAPAKKVKKPAKKTIQPPSTARPATGGMAALQKRITRLEKRVAALSRMYAALKKKTVSRSFVWKTAATVVNRAFGKTANNTTRVPISVSTGGVTLKHIIVGRDKAAGQSLGKEGVRCSIVAMGGKWGVRGYLYVYAVPVTDMIMRNKYLIHADSGVPCIEGRIQTHHVWKGQTVRGVKMAAGRYKIFVRLIVYAQNGKRIGQAMRYWGDARPAAYTIKL